MVNYKILPCRPVPYVKRQSPTTLIKTVWLICSNYMLCMPWIIFLISFCFIHPQFSFPFSRAFAILILAVLELNSNIQKTTFSYNLKQGWKRVKWHLWIVGNRISLVFKRFLEETMKALFLALARSSFTQWILNAELDVMCLMGF